MQEFECETTALFNLLTDKNKAIATIVPQRQIVGVHFDFTTDTYRFAYSFDIKANDLNVGDKVRQSILTITNDPYTKPNGALISLGYYGFRFHINNAVIKSLQPVILETKGMDNFIVSCVTPVRQIPKYVNYENSVRGFNITKQVNGSINMHYLFNQNHSKPFPIVVSSYDKERKGETFIALSNPMSYYQNIGIIESKTYVTQKNQQKAHKEIIKKILLGDK